MKTTDKHFKIIEQYAKMFPDKDDFVILRETSNGTRYIEWEFKKGRPHDCTCLSWYTKAHKGYEDRMWAQVGEVYRLEAMTCDLHKKKRKEDRCTVGSPKADCCFLKFKTRPWKYNEPVKCACWTLIPILNNIQYYYKAVSAYTEIIKRTQRHCTYGPSTKEIIKTTIDTFLYSPMVTLEEAIKAVTNCYERT